MNVRTKRQLKVAIDLTALLPERTGVDNYMTGLVFGLSRIDDQTQYKIFINYEDRQLFSDKLRPNFTVIPRCFRSRVARLVFQQILLPLSVDIWGADIVHSPSFVMPLFKGRARHVLTIHDMTFFSLPDCHTTLRRSKAYRRAVVHSIQNTDMVIVPSYATQTAIHGFLPDFDTGRVRVIPHGIGDEFQPAPFDTVCDVTQRMKLPDSYVLYVGTIEPRKNLRKLVESYELLHTKRPVDEHLVLAGRLGWKYEELVKQVSESPMREKIHLIGYVSQADLPALYTGAELFVYPSIAEGFGFPPLEAMACGVPTISSATSSLVENLQGAAELVCSEDSEALSNAMGDLLNDGARRAKYRKEGFARAASFRWEAAALHVLDCYKELARDRVTRKVSAS